MAEVNVFGQVVSLIVIFGICYVMMAWQQFRFDQERRRWDEERQRLMQRADPGLVLGDETCRVVAVDDAREWKIERDRLKREGLLEDGDAHDWAEAEVDA